jgi:hypothetical protein
VLEKILVAERCPISRFHLAHGITGRGGVTPSQVLRLAVPKIWNQRTALRA